MCAVVWCKMLYHNPRCVMKDVVMCDVRCVGLCEWEDVGGRAAYETCGDVEKMS